MWVQASASLLTFGLFWSLHTRQQPFQFTYQNQIESFLFASSAVVVFLALVYTIPDKQIIALEVLLTTTLLVSIGGVAAHLVRRYRQQQRAMAQHTVSKSVQPCSDAPARSWTKTTLSLQNGKDTAANDASARNSAQRLTIYTRQLSLLKPQHCFDANVVDCSAGEVADDATEACAWRMEEDMEEDAAGVEIGLNAAELQQHLAPPTPRHNRVSFAPDADASSGMELTSPRPTPPPQPVPHPSSVGPLTAPEVAETADAEEMADAEATADAEWMATAFMALVERGASSVPAVMQGQIGSERQEQEQRTEQCADNSSHAPTTLAGGAVAVKPRPSLPRLGSRRSSSYSRVESTAIDVSLRSGEGTVRPSPLPPSSSDGDQAPWRCEVR